MKTEKSYKFFNVNSFCYYCLKYDETFLCRLCISRWSCDLINCYLCRIQASVDIFDDSFCVIYNPPKFFMTILLLNQKYLQMQRTRLVIIMRKLLLAKTRTAWRTCWVKKGRTNPWGENFITNKVPESEWKDNFRMSRKTFCELCDMLRSYLEKKRTRLTTPNRRK